MKYETDIEILPVSLTVSSCAGTTPALRDEVIDNLKALQIGDKYRVTTPVNWNKGDDVIVHPSVSNEEAKTLFPQHTVHKVSTDRFQLRD